MGVEKNIDANSFPKQGEWLGQRFRICFNYDTSQIVEGTCVRDDKEDPGRTIFALDDGRYVLATECQCQQIGTASVVPMSH